MSNTTTKTAADLAKALDYRRTWAEASDEQRAAARAANEFFAPAIAAISDAIGRLEFSPAREEIWWALEQALDKVIEARGLAGWLREPEPRACDHDRCPSWVCQQTTGPHDIPDVTR